MTITTGLLVLAGLIAGIATASLVTAAKRGHAISRDDVDSIANRAYRRGVIAGLQDRSGPPDSDVVLDLIAGATADAAERAYAVGFKDAIDGRPYRNTRGRS